jgi:hypothetical protein
MHTLGQTDSRPLPAENGLESFWRNVRGCTGENAMVSLDEVVSVPGDRVKDLVSCCGETKVGEEEVGKSAGLVEENVFGLDIWGMSCSAAFDYTLSWARQLTAMSNTFAI